MPDELDPARLQDFARRLGEYPRRRIDQRALWTAFAGAFPGRPQGPEERRWLLSALEHLSADGLVRLPSPRGLRWDRTAGVAVPTSVDLIRDPAPVSTGQWRAFPWHPRLQWIADLPYVSVDQEQFLHRVHEGLVQGRFRTPAPLKYRSLQLTGNEKKLQRLMETKLFSPGRLDLNLLGCASEAAPLAWESISEKPRMIIFENAGSFAVARAVLTEMPDPPYGMVAYGAGAQFELSVCYLLTIRRPIERIEYVGDLDWHGLRIALAARRAAKEAGLPDIHPANGLHQAMIEASRRFGRPLGWPFRSSPGSKRKPDASLLDFLPDEIRSDVIAVLQAGNRIPEEVLGPDEFKNAWLRQEPAKRRAQRGPDL